ncbi:MAG: hypothetical protein JWP61_2645 [Friedmanniella sp.]|nr:hypothetical protein [Friedmanniella sp.]
MRPVRSADAGAGTHRAAAVGLRQWWTRFAGAPVDPPPATPIPAVPTEADLLAALDQVEASVAGGSVPGLVAARVRRVTGTVRQTVPRLRNLGLGSPEAYSVIATATDYLPEALAGYTRLPRQWADSRPVEGGKTSLMLLVDQLDLLGATMEEVLDAVVRVDADALIAHGRFLQARFGPAARGGHLDLGSPEPGTAGPLDLP